MGNSICIVDNLIGKLRGKIFFLNIKIIFIFILRGLGLAAEKNVKNVFFESLAFYIVRYRRGVIMNISTTYVCQRSVFIL